jgi:TRAP-type mannitol/chloroaromatic compound transport system permease small subunit
VGFLLKFSGLVDWANEKLGRLANICVLLSCLVSAANAMIRYAFDISSNAWLELQWYMFAVIVMLGASYTLQKNEHVRVDVVYMGLSERKQIWVDILGGIFFLLPACVLLGWLAWPFFMQSIEGYPKLAADSLGFLHWLGAMTGFLVGIDSGAEVSSNAGGLIRWPVKLLLPLGFALIACQGLSEIIKRIAALQGLIKIDAKYERPEQ